MKRMNPRRAHALLRGLAFLATLASSGIGIMFITMAGGMPPLLRILFLIPILSAPVLVGLLVWQAVRPGNKPRQTAWPCGKPPQLPGTGWWKRTEPS